MVSPPKNLLNTASVYEHFWNKTIALLRDDNFGHVLSLLELLDQGEYANERINVRQEQKEAAERQKLITERGDEIVEEPEYYAKREAYWKAVHDAQKVAEKAVRDGFLYWAATGRDDNWGNLDASRQGRIVKEEICLEDEEERRKLIVRQILQDQDFAGDDLDKVTALYQKVHEVERKRCGWAPKAEYIGRSLCRWVEPSEGSKRTIQDFVRWVGEDGGQEQTE